LLQWERVRCWVDSGVLQAARLAVESVAVDPLALQQMAGVCRGVFRQRLAALEDEAAVLPLYRRHLLPRMRHWIGGGAINNAGDEERHWIGGGASNNAGDEEMSLQELRVRHGSWHAEIDMLECCGEALNQVLVGARSPLEALFPEGDAHNAERVFSQVIQPMNFSELGE
jgi:hypothetical protein